MLLDTSGLLCLAHRREPQHDAASALYDEATVRIVQSYVLDEFVALANARGLTRVSLIEFSGRIINDDEIEVVWVDETLHRQALDLLQARLDKTYSLCDAVSFVIMRERGITDALTTDHHFEQEGFVRLLAP